MATADTSILRLAVVQMRCDTNPDVNLQRAVERIEEAAARGAQLVCLQELFRSQYFCQKEDTALFDLAEPVPGPTTDALGRVAAARQVAIVGSVFEKRAPGLFHNTAVLIDKSGALHGLYRKMHIPDDPLYYEKYYFTPGDLGFASHAIAGTQVGALVCWDQWFPEAARITALKGAQVLCYPTAIGWHPHEKEQYGVAQHQAWQIMQRSHAIANGVFVAVANHIGVEGNIEFWGGSFIADPFGRLLAEAAHDREEILLADCDLRLIDETRRNWPFLRDRRIDAYDGLVQRFLDR